MASTTPKPPTGRRTGKPPAHANKLGGIYTSILEEDEDVPELRHPESVPAYSRIASSAQVSPLLRLIKGEVRNYQLEVDPGNAPTGPIAQAAQVMGIPMKGAQDSRRARARRVDLISRTLRAPTLGHAVFEIEGEKTSTGWAMRGLHYLSPKSLWRWQFRGNSTDIDFIEQHPPGGPMIRLEANRLAVIRYDLDPDHPYGESMLRPVYECWLQHGRFARIALVAGERNGMGIPFAEYPEATSPDAAADMQQFSESVAAGEEVGGSGPTGSGFRLVGVDGQVFDLLAHMKYQDERAARVLGGQIIQLGTTSTGSYNVGDHHDGLLWGARDALVEWLCDQLAEEVLHRVAIWSGHDPTDIDGLPSIEWTRPTVVEPLTPDNWAALGAAGWIDPSDEDQRREFERRYSLPASEVRDSAAGVGGSPAAPSSVVAAAAATDTGLVEGVPQARRALSAMERAAHWPFAGLEAAWVETRDQLAALWALTRRQMITAATSDLASLERLHERVDELHERARTAAVATLTADTVTRIADAADQLAEQAANLTRSAIAAQGLTTEAISPGYAEQAARSARAAGQTVALTVADQVARTAARVAGPGVQPAQVAALVEQDLSTLTDALPRRVAGAEATRAQHAGQAAVIESIWPSADIASAYYSSLLDGATCGPCARRDGHRYADMAAVRKDFPSGGYVSCEGGDSCRCTWVFVLDSEMPVGVDDTRSDV